MTMKLLPLFGLRGIIYIIKCMYHQITTVHEQIGIT